MKQRRVVLSIELMTALPIAALRKVFRIVVIDGREVYAYAGDEYRVPLNGADYIAQVQVNVIRNTPRKALREIIRGPKRRKAGK